MLSSLLFCSVLLSYLIFCSVIFCSVLFCSVILCYLLLCYALLSYAMLCDVILCDLLFCSIPWGDLLRSSLVSSLVMRSSAMICDVIVCDRLVLLFSVLRSLLRYDANAPLQPPAGGAATRLHGCHQAPPAPPEGRLQAIVRHVYPLTRCHRASIVSADKSAPHSHSIKYPPFEMRINTL